MSIRSVRLFFLIFAMPGAVLADANSGMFMGYELGSKYQRGPNTLMQVITNGNLIITAENPVKPENIEEVSLITTPESLTIGHIDASSWFDTENEARAFGRQYVDLLRAKYPDWAFGREVMDANLRIVEVNFERPPYSLYLRLNEDRHNGKIMWRMSMTLSWLLDSQEARAWRNIEQSEHITAKEDGRKQLLENADLSGL